MSTPNTTGTPSPAGTPSPLASAPDAAAASLSAPAMAGGASPHAVEAPDVTEAPNPLDLRLLDGAAMAFTRGPTGMLRLELRDESCILRVRLVRLFPIRYPDRYLSVRESGGKEIGILEELASLPAEMRRLVEEELRLTWHVPIILDIHAIYHEQGGYVWDVTTDRGPRVFTAKGRSSLRHHSGGRWFVTDVDEGRYELVLMDQLSAAARRHLDMML